MGQGFGVPFGAANQVQPQLAAGGAMAPPYGSWPQNYGPSMFGPQLQSSPFDRLGPPQHTNECLSEGEQIVIKEKTRRMRWKGKMHCLFTLTGI